MMKNKFPSIINELQNCPKFVQTGEGH